MSSFTATDLVNAKIEAIKDFMNRITEKFEIDNAINELAEKFKEELENDKPLESNKAKKVNNDRKVRKPRTKNADVNNDGDANVVKKREPTLYNLFVKEHIAMDMFKEFGKACMVEVALYWKSEKGIFFTTRHKELKVTNPNLSIQEMYKIIREEWLLNDVESEDEENNE